MLREVTSNTQTSEDTWKIPVLSSNPKKCLIWYQIASKLVKKKTWLRFVFSTHVSVFGYLMKHSSLFLTYITHESHVMNYAAKYQLRLTLSSHLEKRDCKGKRLWAHPLWFKCFAKILNLLLRKNISKTVKNYDNIWQRVIWKPITWTFNTRKRVKHFVLPRENFKNRGGASRKFK